MVSPRRRQLHARDMQIHTVSERENPTKRHLCVHCENEDCCDQTSRRVETDPRPAETCGENQRTRTVLEAEKKTVRASAAQHQIGSRRSSITELVVNLDPHSKPFSLLLLEVGFFFENQIMSYQSGNRNWYTIPIFCNDNSVRARILKAAYHG
jgi:hypothetical protein